jgi:3D (Asp-Asp-Asp) domain-containing protein
MIHFNSKLISAFLVAGHILGFYSTVFADATSTKLISVESEYQETFVVATAYYSPLPNQKRYLRWNYESEIRLNGNGTHGASGKGVFNGMLAAPKTYEFWTKIWIDGLGVGSVEDRGGAIVSKGNRGYEYDRIDIWMGEGDEWLKRALSWGKRTVKARIYKEKSVKVAFQAVPQTSEVYLAQSKIESEGLKLSSMIQEGSDFGISDELEKKMALFAKKRLTYQKLFEPEMNDSGKIRNLSVIEIRKLQEALKLTGYSSTTPNGTMWPKTREAIERLQESKGGNVSEKEKWLFTPEVKRLLIEELLFEDIVIE